MFLPRWWTSENSSVGMRTKQVISATIPDPLLVAIKKRYYAQLLKNKDVPVEKETLALPQIVSKGDFVIDIGANVGFYTRDLASLVGEDGLVWSVEPVPQTFDILSYEIRKFRWSNVEAFNVAVSDSEGTVEMEIPHSKRGGESWYGARIISGETRHPNWRSIAVRTVKLDSFIKCDAEFHELSCLQGARETIGKWHPSLLIETLVDDSYRNTFGTERIVDFLSDFGYTAHLYDGRDFRIRKPRETSQNTFFFYRR
jgi:FkbM family methyltransferase